VNLLDIGIVRAISLEGYTQTFVLFLYITLSYILKLICWYLRLFEKRTAAGFDWDILNPAYHTISPLPPMIVVELYKCMSRFSKKNRLHKGQLVKVYHPEYN